MDRAAFPRHHAGAAPRRVSTRVRHSAGAEVARTVARMPSPADVVVQLEQGGGSTTVRAVKTLRVGDLSARSTNFDVLSVAGESEDPFADAEEEGFEGDADADADEEGDAEGADADADGDEEGDAEGADADADDEGDADAEAEDAGEAPGAGAPDGAAAAPAAPVEG